MMRGDSPHPITLRFGSGDLERAYAEERAAAGRHLHWAALGLALVLYAAFAVLDPWLAQSGTPAIWWIRVAVSALLAVALAVLGRVPTPQRTQVVLAGAVVAMGLGFIAMAALAGPGGGDYVIALVPVILFAHGLVRLRFLSAAVLCWGLTAAYAVTALVFGHVPGRGLANTAVLLSAANLAGMLASYSRERSARAAFLRSQQLRMLVDAMAEGLVAVDGAGRITWVNRSFCAMTGYPAEELIGRSPTGFVDESARSVFAARLAGGPDDGAGHHELEWVRRDGSRFTAIVSGRPILLDDREFRGSVLVVNDITELRAAEAALARSERHFRELVDHASSIILRWDVDGTIGYINPYGLRMLGYTADELLGRNVLDTIVPRTESGGRDLTGLIRDIAENPDRYLRNENEVLDRGGNRFWVVWTNRALFDTQGRVAGILSIGTDITELRRARESLARQRDELAELNEFIRRVFGRYVSESVVHSLLESPGGLRVGGTRRCVTILVADIRGFSSLCEELTAEQVVALLNDYLETMTEVIDGHGGTIDEFVGDGILVIFGAPVEASDHAPRAVACALAMQRAIASVNGRSRASGLPAVEIGIGIHTGEVVVGNIGSMRRAKYSVVGSHVNLASRIESCTVGGQILVSEDTRRVVGPALRTGARMVVEPKGARAPIVLHEACGLAGAGGLPPSPATDAPLAAVDLPCSYSLVEDKFVGGAARAARVIGLSPAAAELACEVPPLPLTDLKLGLCGEADPAAEVYGKVVAVGDGGRVRVRFTSLTAEARRTVEALIEPSHPAGRAGG